MIPSEHFGIFIWRRFTRLHAEGVLGNVSQNYVISMQAKVLLKDVKI